MTGRWPNFLNVVQSDDTRAALSGARRVHGIREMPTPMPKVLTRDVTPEVSASPALSLFARPGDGGIRTRRVAILVADGCDGEALVALADRLTSDGAVPRFVSTTLGSVQPASGDAIEVDISLEAAPSVLYDAVVLPDGSTTHSLTNSGIPTTPRSS